MANSNSKKINMNKKEVAKTLGKKTNTNAKKSNPNKNTTNKKPTNKNNIQKKVDNKDLESNKVKTNVVETNKTSVPKKVNKPVNKNNKNKQKVKQEVKPVVKRETKQEVKPEVKEEPKTEASLEIKIEKKPVDVVPKVKVEVKPKDKNDTIKREEASTTPSKKSPLMDIFKKKNTTAKSTIKNNKTKKKVNKKDIFKVNPDGSLYDLSSIYPKKKESKKKKEVIETPTGIKETSFEELSQKEELLKKQENKKNLKTLLIVIGVICGVLLFGTLGYKKYKQYVKEHLRVYEEYKLGSEIKTADGSIWYVVEYSDKSDSKIKLLKDGLVDINNDDTINENDKMRFSTDSDKYDKTDATGVGYFLLNNYKPVLEGKLGFAIDDIDLLTSKEFVRVRDYLGIGYEWTEGNFLASDSLGFYWINSESDKMYVVSPRGSYKMTSKDSLYFIRCVITVSKDNLKLLDNEE